MKLGEWLKDRGMSAAEFGRRAGVDRCTVHLWIHKKATPRYKNYLKIKEVTNGKVKFEDFFKA